MTEKELIAKKALERYEKRKCTQRRNEFIKAFVESKKMQIGFYDFLYSSSHDVVKVHYGVNFSDFRFIEETEEGVLLFAVKAKGYVELDDCGRLQNHENAVCSIYEDVKKRAPEFLIKNFKHDIHYAANINPNKINLSFTFCWTDKIEELY